MSSVRYIHTYIYIYIIVKFFNLRNITATNSFDRKRSISRSVIDFFLSLVRKVVQLYSTTTAARENCYYNRQHREESKLARGRGLDRGCARGSGSRSRPRSRSRSRSKSRSRFGWSRVSCSDLSRLMKSYIIFFFLSLSLFVFTKIIYFLQVGNDYAHFHITFSVEAKILFNF